jgi:hypothetical protein
VAKPFSIDLLVPAAASGLFRDDTRGALEALVLEHAPDAPDHCAGPQFTQY